MSGTEAATTGTPPTAISVILPNYNHARYLPERIESILAQTRGDFELLILDDCSPDDSREVIGRYAERDPRIRTLFNDANSGNTYRQWQKGLAATTGAYVWVAESDDFADPRLLERLAGALDANPAVGLAFCQTDVVDAESHLLHGYVEGWVGAMGNGYDLAQFGRRFVMNGRDYVRRFMLPWNTIPNASAVLFRREALASIGGPELGLRLCGDWLTYCRLLLSWDVAHEPEHLNFFREHAANVRTAAKGDIFVREALAVTDEMERAVGGLPAAMRRRQRRFYASVVAAASRPPAGGPIPLARAPAALARAWRMRPALVPTTLAMLAREQAGALARRLGVRR